MPRNNKYELVEQLHPDEHDDQQKSSHIHVGSRKTILSSSDMVLPLLCGICVHLFYITLLLPILVLYFNDYDNLRKCMNIHFEIYLISSLIIHTFTVITSILSMIIAFQTKVLNTSKKLNILLTIRLFLNICEIFIIIYGVIVVFINSNNVNCFNLNHSSDEILYTLIAFNCISNIILVFLIWFILCCCCIKKDEIRQTELVETHENYQSLLHKYCSICFYDQKSPKLESTFNQMGGLITILINGNPYDNLELTPSDIITGLHLLRMLQKHYGLFDERFCSPSTSLDTDKDIDKQRLKEIEYYTLYANAAYGIALYTLSSPCAICCAIPCFLPKHFNQNILKRNKSCCCDSIQIDNSSLKIFIQRTGINVNDLLFVSQIGDLHCVNFYVCIDRKKLSLVITLRGTMSIKDSITDIECTPLHFPDIDDNCYVHSGIGKSALFVYNILINNEDILSFLRNNPSYNVIICGHSLGAGVTVVLTLLIIFGKHDNLKYFFNENQHKFRSYAIAPPSCIERNYALSISNILSSYLTCVIYGDDMIPRISFKSIINTRAAINRLLKECIQTPWWIYEKSAGGLIKYNTIINALKDDTKYVNHNSNSDSKRGSYIEVKVDMDMKEENKYDNDNDNELNGEECFMEDVMNDVQNMENISIKHNLSSKELWNTRFCQIGYLFHVLKASHLDVDNYYDDDDDNDNRYFDRNLHQNFECIKNICSIIYKSVICNVLRCRVCLDSDDTKYFIYKANIDGFCDKLLISPNMIADHMPHLYLNVLTNAKKQFF